MAQTSTRTAVSSAKSKISYHVSVLNSSEHLLSVSMLINIPSVALSSIASTNIGLSQDADMEQANKDQSRAPMHSLVLVLPAWIPGSYMIRDFAKNLHALHCTNSEFSLTQIDKQSWQLSRLDKAPFESCQLHYQVYAYDLSVRSAYINDEYAFFNGTSVFLCVKDYEACEHSVTIEHNKTLGLPQTVVTAMTPLTHLVKKNALPDNVTHAFISNDYYDLIDHPFIIGQVDDYCFEVKGHKFHLVFTGKNAFDFARMEADLSPIITHHINLFGDFPCAEYWFMTLLCEQGFGGLEHMASTVLQYSRFNLPMAGDNSEQSLEYRQFLSLCSHELFHTWHVKRIKPEVMHQPNLFAEVYSPQLWIYEGFTSLYDDLSLARAKVITPKQYLQILSEAYTRLLRTPGRHKQSVSTSSLEAWSKFYKQDAGSINHIVSYYNKGTIIALCLDIVLRQQSNNQLSLDDLMRMLWVQYGKPAVGTPDDVILTLCKKEFDIDLGDFLHLATKTTSELPLATLLPSIGLQLHLRSCENLQDKGGVSVQAFAFDLGASVSNDGKFLKVNSVLHARAASRAGMQVGDCIIAFNHWQCDEKRFIRVLQQANMGDILPLHVLRDGRLLHLDFKVLPAILDTCDIQIENEALFLAWLGLS